MTYLYIHGVDDKLIPSENNSAHVAAPSPQSRVQRHTVAIPTVALPLSLFSDRLHSVTSDDCW